MNKFLKCLMPVAALTVAGCSDEFKNEQPTSPIAFKGDEVVFVVGSQDPVSRTTYAEEWAEEENQQIFWGNYLTNDAHEKIRIFCRQSAHGTAATYLLTTSATEPSSAALGISKVSENEALQWGDKTVTHDFYAFYPAEKCSNDFINQDGAVISGNVDTQQSPNYYRAKFGTSGEFKAKTLKEIADNNTESEDQQTTIYAMPDMESAIMVAKKSVAATEYGQSVPLDFDVIADVLDITVNGPITPNTLGGNAESGLKRQNITINSILIQSSSIDQKLTGDFTIDMATGTVTPSQDANNQLVVYLADSEGLHPTLHVRAGKPAEGKPVVDKLRARVFIMPGQVKNLSDLTITIGTNCGNYVQKLDSHDMVSGAIHPIKLKYFQQRGTTLDFSKWIGQLDPNIYLSELSIPGTWHSSNEASQGAAAKDLAEQYAKGIRAFEVHTTNGTDLYNDYHFDTAQKLTAENAKYFTTPSNTSVKENDKSYSGGTFSPSDAVSGQSSRTRQVTASDVTVTINATKIDDYKADYALRLFRTVRNTTTSNNSLSDAVMELAPNMNSTGFMVLEFGMNGSNGVSGIPVKQVITSGMTATISGVTLTGTQTGSYAVFGYRFDAPSLTNVTWQTATYNGKDYNLDELYTLIADNAWSGGTETTSYTTTSVTGGEAWAVAVQSCLKRLAERDFTTKDGITHKVLYTDRITPETTIADVRGHVIVKINTNSPTDGYNEIGWNGTQIPALFSRWVDDSASEPRTINLNWGAPTEKPTPLLEGPSDLHWCYTEQDNINKNNGSIASRKAALDAFAKVSAQNYVEGLHRTFYECAIGGYINGSNTAENYLAAAKELNPYLIQVLQDPSRPAAPFGFVFMSYAIAPTTQDAEELKSDELISTIINNNVAFLLNRRGGTSTQTNAADNTNSSFTGNTGNPLK